MWHCFSVIAAWMWLLGSSLHWSILLKISMSFMNLNVTANCCPGWDLLLWMWSFLLKKNQTNCQAVKIFKGSHFLSYFAYCEKSFVPFYAIWSCKFFLLHLLWGRTPKYIFSIYSLKVARFLSTLWLLFYLFILKFIVSLKGKVFQAIVYHLPSDAYLNWF